MHHIGGKNECIKSVTYFLLNMVVLYLLYVLPYYYRIITVLFVQYNNK